MALPLGKKPYHLLTPKWINRVWHIDLLTVQVLWLRFSVAAILDDFKAWFNESRPHSALHGRTPQEAWEGHVLPGPVAIRTRDQLQPQIEIRRRHYRGDPRLPVLDISVRLAA